MKSKVFSAITWILGILGFIGGVILGELINQMVMLFVWGGMAILCLLFAGITCILKCLEELVAGNKKNIESNVTASNKTTLESAKKDN